MKKFKNLFLVAAVALFGFSSCLGGDVETGYHDGNVRLQMALSTRAIGPSQTDAPVAITSGYVIFTAGQQGTVQHYFRLGQGDVTMTALQTTGIVFNDISASANYVHFVGNTTISPAMVEGVTSMAAVLNQVLNVTSQGGTLEGNNQVVNVYGRGGIASGVANFEVEPTVARFEIHRITGDRSIAGFRVDGIFMDRYFEEARLDGRLMGNYFERAQGATACVAAFNFPGNNTFTPAMRHHVFDWNENGWIAANTITVNDGTPFANAYLQGTRPAPTPHVWGYNLFANYSNVARTEGSRFPVIVIRMTHVNVRVPTLDPTTGAVIGYTVALHPGHDGVPTTPLFITIRGFAPADTGIPLNPATGFLPRRVYQIGTTPDGWFSKDDLSTYPYPGDIIVDVTIVPMAWVPIPGRPIN